MSNRFFLVDCNNFFVSCERVFNPALRNKPVAVLSSGDACIIARSNEVKALGVPMGAPLFKWEKVLASHGVHIYSANFALYGDMSARVMNALAAHATDIEVYSVDEAFMWVSDYTLPVHYDSRFYYTAYGHFLRKTVKQSTGIPVSIGIGPTKTLAKIANHLAKKNPWHDGVLDITQHPDRDALLASVSVEDIWGVGYRYGKKLKNKGIVTAYDFIQLDDQWVKKNMTIMGLKTLHELRGIPCYTLETNPESRQSICVSRLFNQKTTDKNNVYEAIAQYTTMAAAKMRAQKSQTARVMVFALTSTYHDPKNYYSYASTELPLATSYTPTLITAAHHAATKIYKPGLLYKKVGVILLDLNTVQGTQLSTYVQMPNLDQQSSLMKIIDRANNRWGRNKITFAAAGLKQEWKMKQTRKSQCFTTSWKELLTIQV